MVLRGSKKVEMYSWIFHKTWPASAATFFVFLLLQYGRIKKSTENFENTLLSSPVILFVSPGEKHTSVLCISQVEYLSPCLHVSDKELVSDSGRWEASLADTLRSPPICWAPQHTWLCTKCRCVLSFTPNSLVKWGPLSTLFCRWDHGNRHIW